MEIKLCWLCFLSKTQNNKMQARWSMAERVRGVRFSLHVAWRYLFSRKSHNAVNVITGISSAGIAVGAMAMVCVMSVFNGIESLVSDMFSSFDPDLKITAVEGKTFSLDSAAFDQVHRLPGVEVFNEVVEENALVSFRDKHIPATVKGVDEQCFRRMTRIDSILFDGEFVLFDGGFERIVPGNWIDVSYTAFGQEACRYLIPNEFELHPEIEPLPSHPGCVCMGGYGEAGLAGCEFFFPLRDCPEHKGIYPVFGRVLEGMEELRRLERVETVPVTDFPIEGVEVNRPVEPQVIERVEAELYGGTYPEPVRVENPKLPPCWR